MANRTLSSNQLIFDKKGVVIYARVNIGATGAPTLQSRNGKTYVNAPATGWNGIKSISRTSAGLYVLTLQDSWVALAAFWGGFQKDTVPSAPSVFANSTGTNVNSTTAPQITFTCYNSAGTATDPANGEVMLLEIELIDSTA